MEKYGIITSLAYDGNKYEYKLNYSIPTLTQIEDLVSACNLSIAPYFCRVLFVLLFAGWSERQTGYQRCQRPPQRLRGGGELTSAERYRVKRSRQGKGLPLAEWSGETASAYLCFEFSKSLAQPTTAVQELTPINKRRGRGCAQHPSRQAPAERKAVEHFLLTASIVSTPGSTVA